MVHQYVYNVKMTCGGCSGAVERVLKKLDGVESFDVSRDTQTASVTTADEVDYDTVLQAIKKTGKTVTPATADGVPVPADGAPTTTAEEKPQPTAAVE